MFPYFDIPDRNDDILFSSWSSDNAYSKIVFYFYRQLQYLHMFRYTTVGRSVE